MNVGDARVCKQSKRAAAKMILIISLIFDLMVNNPSVLSLEDHCFENSEIGIFIISQSNRHHNALADFKKKDILKQAESYPKVKVNVFKTHQDFGNVVGHWAVLPLFKKLSNFSKFTWFLFLDETTNVQLEAILSLLSLYNNTQDHFVGHALIDKNPTIIHHFANPFEESSISYPFISAGFFLSYPLIKKLNKRCEDCSFSIDPKYELAKYIKEITGVKLKHEPRFCLERTSNCATWMDIGLPDCGNSVIDDKFFVAVKTCKKYHNDRVSVVKNTWAPDVKNINFFSDSEDKNIPTIKLAVPNVSSGHCEKTLSIMKYYVHNNIPIDWLVIVDDDTLLSVLRLKTLLACYFSSEFVAVGERYGYSVVDGTGYDYLTGGSGMIFSISTVKQLVRSCSCPTSNSPDDMIIGLCLKNLKIPITHSPFFHQARPVDYASKFLKSSKHISFHKHWLVDPLDVYKTWLNDHISHQEL